MVYIFSQTSILRYIYKYIGFVVDILTLIVKKALFQFTNYNYLLRYIFVINQVKTKLRTHDYSDLTIFLTRKRIFYIFEFTVCVLFV